MSHAPLISSIAAPLISAARWVGLASFRCLDMLLNCGSLIIIWTVLHLNPSCLSRAATVSDNVMFRRTRNGRILQLRCQALRRYWHDFGRLQEKDVDAVVLWGRHLAYATALGDAHLVRSELRRGDARLGRLAETVGFDDQSWVDRGEPVSDAQIEEWLTTLGLPVTEGGARAVPVTASQA